MEISFDKKQKTQGVIKISVNKADFQPGVDRKIKEYSKTASIKGFRPGKVPEGMIRKMYGSALIVDEINKLVSDKLNSYLRESEIQFLGEPLPVPVNESIDWENQQNFDFEYAMGFAEPFEVKVDKKVKMDKHIIKVDETVIEETIENLQRQFGEIEHPEVVSERDTLYGILDNKEKSLGNEISIDLRDLEKSALKKFIGARVDQEIELDGIKAFKHEGVLKNQLRMDDEEFKKLKKLKFHIKTINHYQLAPINQELFDKTFGKDSVKDETEFREKVKEIVSKNYEGEAAHFFNHQIREKLIENSKINLPDEFLKKWMKESNEEVTSELIDLEYTSYSKELKWSLIRNQLVKNKEIKVEHEEVVNEAKELIKRQFDGSGIGGQLNSQLDIFASNYLQGENGENYMKVFNQVQTSKVLQFIKDEITVKEKTVSLDEFRKL